MQVMTRSAGNFMIMDLVAANEHASGIDPEENWPAFETELRKSSDVVINEVSAAISNGNSNIALNLTGAEYIHSGGIGVLAQLLARVQQAKGRFCIIARNKNLAEIIDTVGLSEAIEIYTSEDEFLKANA